MLNTATTTTLDATAGTVQATVQRVDVQNYQPNASNTMTLTSYQLVVTDSNGVKYVCPLAKVE